MASVPIKPGMSDKLLADFHALCGKNRPGSTL